MSYLRYKNLAWYRDDRAEAVRRREEDVNLQINFQVAKLSVIVRDGMEKANGRARHREFPGSGATWSWSPVGISTRPLRLSGQLE
jgi:hypothetical protein